MKAIGRISSPKLPAIRTTKRSESGGAKTAVIGTMASLSFPVLSNLILPTSASGHFLFTTLVVGITASAGFVIHGLHNGKKPNPAPEPQRKKNEITPEFIEGIMSRKILYPDNVEEIQYLIFDINEYLKDASGTINVNMAQFVLELLDGQIERLQNKGAISKELKF